MNAFFLILNNKHDFFQSEKVAKRRKSTEKKKNKLPIEAYVQHWIQQCLALGSATADQQIKWNKRTVVDCR